MSDKGSDMDLTQYDRTLSKALDELMTLVAGERGVTVHRLNVEAAGSDNWLLTALIREGDHDVIKRVTKILIERPKTSAAA